MVACIFGDHALGFLETIYAGLAEVLSLGNGADRIDVALDITGNELAVSTYPALEVDKVVGVADSTDALGDLLTLSHEALVLWRAASTSCWACSQLAATFAGRPGPRFPGSAVGGVVVLAYPLERLLGLWRPPACLTARGADNRLAEFMLHMEEVRRVMTPR